MIRVNLMKGGMYDDPMVGFESESAASGAQKQMAIKLLVLLMGVGGLYTYEFLNLSQLKQEVVRNKRQANKFQQNVQRKRQEVGQAKLLQREIQTLENKIAILKQLSGKRLVEIKALDLVQNLVPEKLWLSRLTYKDKKFEVSGLALEDQELTQFVTGLEQRPNFENVILLQARERTTQEGTVKEFAVSFQLREGS